VSALGENFQQLRAIQSKGQRDQQDQVEARRRQNGLAANCRAGTVCRLKAFCRGNQALATIRYHDPQRDVLRVGAAANSFCLHFWPYSPEMPDLIRALQALFVIALLHTIATLFAIKAGEGFTKFHA